MIAPPTTSPTLLNIPVILFQIPPKKSTITSKTLFIALTAPPNISEKKETTPLNILTMPFHILDAIVPKPEKIGSTTFIIPVNNPLKKSPAMLNTLTITSQALPNI